MQSLEAETGTEPNPKETNLERTLKKMKPKKKTTKPETYRTY
jgi:hypothetical protein